MPYKDFNHNRIIQLGYAKNDDGWILVHEDLDVTIVPVLQARGALPFATRLKYLTDEVPRILQVLEAANLDRGSFSQLTSKLNDKICLIEFVIKGQPQAVEKEPGVPSNSMYKSEDHKLLKRKIKYQSLVRVLQQYLLRKSQAVD